MMGTEARCCSCNAIYQSPLSPPCSWTPNSLPLHLITNLSTGTDNFLMNLAITSLTEYDAGISMFMYKLTPATEAEVLLNARVIISIKRWFMKISSEFSSVKV